MGAGGWLPSAAFDARTSVEVRPRQGCNAIRCDRCGASVRQVPGLELTAPLDPADAYLAPDLAALAQVRSSATGRLYTCGCALHVEHVHQDLRPVDGGTDRPFLAWQCGGHPSLPVPADLDGTLIDGGLDALALVGRRARRPGDGLPDGLHGGDLDVPAFWLLRLHHLLTDADRTDVADRVATAVADRLDDVDPVVRLVTLTFFNRLPTVPAAAALAGLAGRPDEVVHLDGRRWDLGKQLRAALAARIRAAPAATGPEPRALDALRTQTLRPGSADRAVIRLLGQVDLDWVEANAVRVVAAGPQHVDAVLEAVRGLSGPCLADLAADLAVVPGVGVAAVVAAAARALGEDDATLVAHRLAPP